LDRDITVVEQQLSDLNHTANARKQIEDQLRSAQEQVDLLEKQSPPPQSLKSWRSAVTLATDELSKFGSQQDLERSIRDIQAALDSRLQLKDRIESRMNDLIDIERPRQTFKMRMSIIFASLVGITILGVFVLCWKDESVRKQIFSAQAGIQFVTLFSLVIAIILFGITQILEGKELAALLGGLSGYILGRATPASAEVPH
jgi:uncharacterized protein (DUF2164 family)